MLEIPDDRGVFRIEIDVRTEDIDEQNHVNNVVYLRWTQEVAYAHWKTLGSPELLSRYNWVVLRHEIDYHSPALPGDRILLSTWIDIPEGPKQKRYVSVKRLSDSKTLASACTTWCLLDSVSGRPRRVTEEITDVFGLKH